jgi:hypothetical protein
MQSSKHVSSHSCHTHIYVVSLIFLALLLFRYLNQTCLVVTLFFGHREALSQIGLGVILVVLYFLGFILLLLIVKLNWNVFLKNRKDAREKKKMTKAVEDQKEEDKAALLCQLSENLTEALQKGKPQVDKSHDRSFSADRDPTSPTSGDSSSSISSISNKSNDNIPVKSKPPTTNTTKRSQDQEDAIYRSEQLAELNQETTRRNSSFIEQALNPASFDRNDDDAVMFAVEGGEVWGEAKTTNISTHLPPPTPKRRHLSHHMSGNNGPNDSSHDDPESPSAVAAKISRANSGTPSAAAARLSRANSGTASAAAARMSRGNPENSSAAASRLSRGHPENSSFAAARMSRGHPEISSAAAARMSRGHPENSSAAARMSRGHPEISSFAAARTPRGHSETPSVAAARSWRGHPGNSNFAATRSPRVDLLAPEGVPQGQAPAIAANSARSSHGDALRTPSGRKSRTPSRRKVDSAAKPDKVDRKKDKRRHHNPGRDDKASDDNIGRHHGVREKKGRKKSHKKGRDKEEGHLNTDDVAMI